MALYNETDDWQRFAREQMQNSAQNLQQKQAGLDAAKNQKTKTTLESALSGLFNGLKERGSDILNTINNIEKTKYGWLNQIGANKSIENAQKEDSARRNEIAKKYGFNSYAEAINSDKVGDDFWNEIKANNEQTKQNLKAKTDAYRNNFTDVTKVNTNEAKGQALNTIDSVLGLIPGAGGVAANVAGGAIAGVGDEYKRVGREGGDFNLDNALKNAAVGGASGLAGSAGSAGLGKVATKFGGNAVGKALGSNLASGVAGGASAGAIGGALGTALNGGSLEDALLAAKEGAKAGGIGGGVMAGTMGLGGTALEKLRNRGTTAQTIEPVEAQIVQKNRIEAPTAERIPSTVESVEPVSNKRGIAITDLDAGEQAINVRNAKQTLKNNTKKPSYYYYPEEQSIKPIAIDADGNYNVTDGINTIKTINGKVGTYNGSGDWKGAKVFDGQDGRGIPEGYKLMANENAAPSNEYVAIVNRSGEKALIKLPQASDYDYERVGLATGTTRESLANSGLIESADDYKPSKPYTKNGRKFIDGVVRGKNLPEAQGKTFADLGEGKNIVNAMANPDSIFGGDEGISFLLDPDTLPKNLRDRVKVATAGYADEFGNPYADYEQYGITSAEGLPKLDRQEYYYDTQGKLKQQGGTMTKADIPEYMQSHLRNDQNRAGYGRTDNESIMREIFGDNMSKEDMYRLYDEIASIEPNRAKYTTENAAGALAGDDRLRADVENYFVNETFPTRKINIESALSNTQDVPVESLTTNYRRSTIPARQYDQQTIKAMPEAEITKPKTVATAPEQRVATQERQVAANISPADQARLERDITVLEQKQGNELLKQYGVLDKPTRRIVEDAPKVLANLQDSMGLTTPEEVQYAANHVTGGDGILAKATNKLASTATVDTRFEPNFIESLIEINGLNEADAKAVSKQIKGALNKLGEKRKYVNGSDVLDTVKQLQGIARDYKGTSGTYHNATNADKFKVHVIEGVAQELEDRLWNSASPNIKQVITPELLNNMKQMYPDNATWQNFVDNTVANARNGKELRAIQKPLVMGGYIVKGSKMSAGSFGETVANGAIQAGGAKGAAKNTAKVIADKVFNSPKQQQKRATKYQQQKQNAEAQLYGEAPVANTGRLGAIAGKAGNIAQGAKNLGNKVADMANKATASLNNDYIAGINGIRTRNGNPIEFNALGNQAQQFANKQMGKAEAERSQNRLENAQAVANAQADYDNALADYNAQEANYNANMAQAQNQASANGTANTLARINNAMELAMQAGDINAYSQLADLYKQAYNIYEMQNPQTKNEGKALTSTQSKALAGLQQLETLKGMKSGARTALADSPLGGLIDLTGGDEYSNQAKSLALTLGYLQSGANITPKEAEKIGKAYIPTAFDSEETRQGKLARAEQLLRDYLADTSALQA